jgi:uncharacterized protein YkwD
VAKCDRCETDALLNTCNYCQGEFCKSHVLPENHDCVGLRVADTPGIDLRGRDGDTEPNAEPVSTSRRRERTDPGAELPGAAKDHTTTSSPDVNPDGSIARAGDDVGESDSQGSFSARARRAVATITGLALMAILAPFRAVKRFPSYLRRFNRWLDRLLGSLFGLIKTITPILLIALGVLFVAGLVGTGVPVIDDNAEAGAGAVAGMLDTDTKSEEEAIETAVHREVNEVRAERGLGALDHNPALRGVAKNHSRDMAERDFYAHENPDGEHSRDRVIAAGISCNAIGENLNYKEGFSTGPNKTAENAVESWMASSGHRRNLLREGWRSQGIGVEIRGDELWVTQVFCG